jgi:Flp pilus assembly protein TadD
VTRTLQIIGGLLVAAGLFAGCNYEILEKQAQQLKEQQAEIARQRQEIEALIAAQQLEEQKRRDCNRAFRDFFEKAHQSKDAETAVALYHQGLALCPDDEIAHYELGKLLAAQGRVSEAEKEFEAALKLNPDFSEAQNQLEAMRKER